MFRLAFPTPKQCVVSIFTTLTTTTYFWIYIRVMRVHRYSYICTSYSVVVGSWIYFFYYHAFLVSTAAAAATALNFTLFCFLLLVRLWFSLLLRLFTALRRPSKLHFGSCIKFPPPSPSLPPKNAFHHFSPFSLV